MMREQYTVVTYPNIDKIYLVWDDDYEYVTGCGSKCIFVYIGGLQYRLVFSFAYWQDMLTNISCTHSSGIYTLTSIDNTDSISYWKHHAVFANIESLIEDLTVRAILEAL